MGSGSSRSVVGSVAFDDSKTRHWVSKPDFIITNPPLKPAYCEKCGSELVTHDNRVEKYDRFTGEPYKVGSVQLRCPLYDVATVEGRSHDSITWDESKVKPIKITYRGIEAP